MLRTSDRKDPFRRLALKSAWAAALITSLLSCGGGSGGSAGAAPSAEPVPASNPAAEPAAIAAANTAAQLDKFWTRYGAKDSFPPKYVELLEKLLEAEDKVVLKDFQGARLIVDDLIKKNPLMDNDPATGNAWWDNYSKAQARAVRPHLGEPGPYAHLRMLDEITRIGVKKPLLGKTALQMAVVMPACTDIAPQEGPTLTNQRLNPAIEENDYAAVRQSLRLFQSYILAISDGELSLELNFYKIDKCFSIKKETEYLGGNFNEPLLQLPKGVAEKTDMFWLIYPNDNDKGAKITFSSGISMFYNTAKPVFMCEDDWVIKKRAPDQGVGARTEVERRFYLPEWFQHEFFHHLFASWPELKLEGPKFHEWYDRAFWPADFVGREEEDYYSESLRKRFYNQPVSIAQKLKRAGK